MYKNLNQYIEALRAAGELAEIAVPVSSELEISEITDRISKQPGGGKALLFTNTGTDFPVLTNMMGSDKRMGMALGVERLEELAERIDDLFKKVVAPKASLSDKMKMLPLLGKASRWLPRTKSGRGECQQVVMERPDLGRIPILKCWPFDGGPFVTLPMVHTKDPETGIRNVGMYRMQVFSPDTTGMHWHRHKTGARHYEAYKKQGKRMPVSVCIGGDPAYTYAATAPLPDGIDEYLLAGFIRQKPVELVKCLTNDLEVPVDCDFVIEGYVDPAEEPVIEGPFGDHTGFYSLEDLYPVFHVTCITHRKDAVYPATIVGIPPQEDAYIAKATEKLFLAPIRLVMQPEIRELYMPTEGVAHNIALINIEKTFPGQGFKVANSMWGAGQMMFNKFSVIASTERSIYDLGTLRELVQEISIPRDVMFSKGPLDVLDHTADVMGIGGKMCFDATEKMPEEGAGIAYPMVSVPKEWVYPEGVTFVNDIYASEWRTLFVAMRGGVKETPAELVQELLEKNGAQGLKFVFVFDNNVTISDPSVLMWLASSNCDAGRDVSVIGDYLLFDARIKAGVNGFNRPWPNVVTMDKKTIDGIDRDWYELGLGNFIPSPSMEYIPLIIGEGATAYRKPE